MQSIGGASRAPAREGDGAEAGGSSALVALLDEWCDLTEPLHGVEPDDDTVDEIMRLREEMEKIIGASRMDVVRRARMEVLREQTGDCCQTCGALLEFDPKYADWKTTRPIPGRKKHEAQYRATIDHIKPKSKGGNSRLDNLALYCQPCNGRKGNQYEEPG